MICLVDEKNIGIPYFNRVSSVFTSGFTSEFVVTSWLAWTNIAVSTSRFFFKKRTKLCDFNKINDLITHGLTWWPVDLITQNFSRVWQIWFKDCFVVQISSLKTHVRIFLEINKQRLKKDIAEFSPCCNVWSEINSSNLLILFFIILLNMTIILVNNFILLVYDYKCMFTG
jgi:hypothetical protein